MFSRLYIVCIVFIHVYTHVILCNFGMIGILFVCKWIFRYVVLFADSGNILDL